MAGAISALAPVSVAGAADLPMRSPPPPPLPMFAAFTWTGIYAGVQVGYDQQREHLVEVFTAGHAPTGLSFNYKPDGFTGGGHVGANYQFGQVVVGAVADFEGSTMRDTFVDTTFGLGKGSGATDWQGSVRGRLGYAFDRFLVYATGGFAYAHVTDTYIANGPPVLTETFRHLRKGWTVGGGLDYALTDNWIVSAEYRYSDYGRLDNVSNVAFPTLTGLHYLRDNAARVGLSYKF